ncbi:hypothetical protein V8E55_009857 [Tylopilus felleus]
MGHSHILDDHFGHWNWKKEALEQLMGSITVDHASKLSEWEKQVLDWETDRTRTNLYEHKGEKLAKEDTDLLLRGDAPNVHEDCTMSMFIGMGLEIEELYNLCQWQINSWVKLQQLFLPTVTADQAKRQTDVDTVVPPELFELMLPSKSFIWKFKDKNLRGQGANTCVQNTLKGIKARIDRAANKYNEAHHALSTLSSPLNETSWASILWMSDLLWGETEGTQKLSWIWSTHGLVDDTTDETGAIEDIHIEWCKVRAHAHRWAEEVDLLLKEMRRIAVFFDWEVACWQRRAVEFTSNDPCLLEGFRAYALRQASL